VRVDLRASFAGTLLNATGSVAPARDHPDVAEVRSAVSIPSSRTSRIVGFLIHRLALKLDELVEVRDAIDTHIRGRVAVAPPSSRRTLYLPNDALDDL